MNTITEKEIGYRLKQRREELGITQIEASKLLKIKQSTLSNYETGKRLPSIIMLKKITDIYNQTSIDWIIGRGIKKEAIYFTNDKNNNNN